MARTPYAAPERVEEQFEAARAYYARVGVDAAAAVERALAVPISLHCWQTDDVRGFETLPGARDGGGLMATGNYPGRARTGNEARRDLEKVLALAPGVHRINLHACYAETGGRPVDRDELAPEHFGRWLAWARRRKVAPDFNPTYFAHPRAAGGFTLSHPDPEVRAFWVRHGIASRRIAEHFGRAQGAPCVNNHWIPDGAKDSPADRWGPRARLIESYDRIFDPALGVDAAHCVDAVESKLFGLGSEDYVVGSHDFYSHYALQHGLVLCLDMGHYHPTETLHDKLSALLQFHRRLLLHTSRPLRWDSDHVVIFNDDVARLFLEIARGRAWDRVLVALDFFDASINRVAAYVIGARATRKAILYAALDPADALRELESRGRNAQKLALMEEMKTLPFGAVWDQLCLRAGVPPGPSWLTDLERYERTVQNRRH